MKTHWSLLGVVLAAMKSFFHLSAIRCVKLLASPLYEKVIFHWCGFACVKTHWSLLGVLPAMAFFLLSATPCVKMLASLMCYPSCEEVIFICADTLV